MVQSAPRTPVELVLKGRALRVLRSEQPPPAGRHLLDAARQVSSEPRIGSQQPVSGRNRHDERRVVPHRGVPARKVGQRVLRPQLDHEVGDPHPPRRGFVNHSQGKGDTDKGHLVDHEQALVSAIRGHQVHPGNQTEEPTYHHTRLTARAARAPSHQEHRPCQGKGQHLVRRQGWHHRHRIPGNHHHPTSRCPNPTPRHRQRRVAEHSPVQQRQIRDQVAQEPRHPDRGHQPALPPPVTATADQEPSGQESPPHRDVGHPGTRGINTPGPPHDHEPADREQGDDEQPETADGLHRPRA